MQCPVCSTGLGTGTHEGVSLHGCATCGGRFATFDALRTMLTTETNERSEQERADAMSAAGTAATVAADERPALSCPACQSQMRRYVHQYASGVWLDACDAHGVWLDAGELERLEAYAEAVARGATQAPSTHRSPRRPPIAEQDPFDDIFRRPRARDVTREVVVGTIAAEVLGGFVAPDLGVDLTGAVGAWRDLGRSDQRERDLLERTRRELAERDGGSGG